MCSKVIEKSQAAHSRARRNNTRVRNVDDDGKSKKVLNDIPVPKEFCGQIKTGKICDIWKRGRGQFGFIFIGFQMPDFNRIFNAGNIEILCDQFVSD